ncbi:hypothetical protein Tco_1020490 [Tanacetum coccineum]
MRNVVLFLGQSCAYDCYVNINWVCPFVNALAGRLLGVYDLGVTTPSAVVHADDKNSGDARSWCVLIKVNGWFWRLKTCTLGDLGFKTEVGYQSQEPEDALLEAEESLLLGSRVPLMGEEFGASKPSDSAFRKRYRSSYETPSPSPSLTLLVWKMYRERESQGLDDEGQGLDDEDQGLEDEGPSMEVEGATPECQQQAVLVVDTTASEPLGLRYGVARHRAIESTKEIAPSKYEVGQSSRFMPGHKGAEKVSAFRKPTLVTLVDLEDGKVYTDILTYAPPVAPVQTPPSLEWSSGSLPVSPSSQ